MEEYVITVRETNHPAILKFEANQPLVHQGNYEFKNIDEAKDSPLAQQLFHLPFVKTVYVSGDFIALERFDIVSWEDVRDAVAQQLVEYLNAGGVAVHEGKKQPREAVTVYAEVTPNPAVMKFVANKKLVPSVYEFKNIDEAKDSPLARKLFELPFVREVFMDLNYISVSKYEVADWNEVTMEVREMIRDFLADGGQVLAPGAVPAQRGEDTVSMAANPNLDATSQEIISILDEYVKPAVASDGGNIVFQSYDPDSKKVHVILQGACSGCPSSTFTLKNGIQTMLQNMMGEKVGEVVAVNG
ncbi:MAG: NifU family protein [Robiginitalea sp.]|uniref:NifU family protein n=1 Tax=Robiginitalea sp. TaxID=1902411 RepID=UPI003C7678AD